jgi:hypothetical protein
MVASSAMSQLRGGDSRRRFSDLDRVSRAVDQVKVNINSLIENFDLYAKQLCVHLICV